jgi:hypothetical protein
MYARGRAGMVVGAHRAEPAATGPVYKASIANRH